MSCLNMVKKTGGSKGNKENKKNQKNRLNKSEFKLKTSDKRATLLSVTTTINLFFTLI